MQKYSSKEFPLYAFIPGVNAHPLKPGGHMFEVGEPESPKIISKDFKDHELYLYSIDLFNHGYFWESHAYLEAIWNANKRVGDEANLCKAIIKIAAGMIKFKQNDHKNARIHLERSLEILKDDVREKISCGINISELSIAISHMLSELHKSLPQVSINIALKF